MDARLYLYSDGFVENVDNGYTPILSTEFIVDVNKKFITLKTDFENTDILFENAIDEISDIFTPPRPSVRGNTLSGYEACIDKLSSVEKSVIDFDTSHAKDMDIVDTTLNTLEKALAQMEAFSKSGLDKYVRNSFVDTCVELAELRLESSAYMAENVAFISDATIGLLNSLGIPFGLLAEAGDTVDGIHQALKYNDILKLYSYGMRYELCEVDGKIFYRLITNIDSIAELQKYLQDLGFPLLKYKTLMQLTDDGIPLMNTNTGKLMNKKIIQAMDNIGGFAMVADDITGGSTKVTRVIKNLSVMGDIADGVGYVLTAGICAYENIYNPKTGKWELTSGDKIKSAITDTGTDIALDLAATAAGALGGAKLGALIGTAIGGPLGAAIGGVAGAVIGGVGASLLTNLPTFGEPPKSIVDYAKDGVDWFTDESGKFLSKIFW